MKGKFNYILKILGNLGKVTNVHKPSLACLIFTIYESQRGQLFCDRGVIILVLIFEILKCSDALFSHFNQIPNLQYGNFCAEPLREGGGGRCRVLS